MSTRKPGSVGVANGAAAYAALFETKDADQKSRQIANLAAGGKQAVPDLINALYCEDPEKIADLCRVLVAIGKPSINPLAAELKNPNQFVQGAAIQVLAELGPASANAVLSAMAKGDQAAIGAGTVVIRQMGSDALPALKAASDPKSPRHSSKAIDLLIELDAQAATVLTGHLKEGLGSEDQFMAGAAIHTFKQMGSGAVSHLVGFLEDPNPYIQQNSMSAIVDIGEPAIPHLIDALGDESQLTQQNAYAALLRIGKPAAKPLMDALNSESPVLAHNAKRLLLELGTNPKNPSKSWWRVR